MAWENRFFFIVGHNGPAPYLIRHQDDIQVCHTAPLTRPFLVAIAVDFVYYVSRRRVFSVCSSSCVVIRHVGIRIRQRRYVSLFFSPVADHDISNEGSDYYVTLPLRKSESSPHSSLEQTRLNGGGPKWWEWHYVSYIIFTLR